MKTNENEFMLDGVEYEAVVSGQASCIGCEFDSNQKLCGLAENCTAEVRSDGVEVIFKRKGYNALEPSYKEIEAKYKEAQSLLDACYEVVELWDCQAPSQIEWKREWLEGARKHGACGE